MNPMLRKMSPSATKMIRLDHSHALVTFHKYEHKTPPQTKRAIVNTVSAALEIHAQLEEEIFYPAIRELDPDGEVISKSVPEHDEMRRLIAKLRATEPPDAGFDDTFMELMRDVIHHVADEETVLLPAAERLLGEERLGDLGARMTKRRLELAMPRAGEIAINTARAMPTSTVLMTAGAVVAGGFLVRRALSSRL
ncbi:hemerythrin domain-containing protein [Methylibium sp.]|uniref:hemerythrin domain-containing protein n=1 Tax=Methylibium sp. TaxID=2067992 RepID=UPI0017FE2AA5|nr:hemerythrin domain-containing protein [Methylibium sp.]MBA3589440.1 hemerythrin domain-containing protein [Methylibium sp.]